MNIVSVVLFLTFVLGCVALIANVPTWMITYGFAVVVLGAFGALVGELFYSVVFVKEEK